MATMNVSLPDPMKDWVESQAQGGRYANSSDYVRDLIRRDQAYQEKRWALIQALIDGENSGDADYSLEALLQELDNETVG